MNYRVRVGGAHPQVVDKDGKSVPNSHVHEIRFPQERIAGIDGNVYVISGPGAAEATVGGKRLVDLPLC